MLHRDALRPDLAPVDLRRAAADDLPVIAEVDGRSFGFHYSDADLDDLRPLFDPDRFLLARDDGAVVGVTGSFPFDVTLPGGAVRPAAGVTWVSVSVTHRRRGLLRALLAEQHRDFVADGTALALLTASEGGIYGRFGYGVATEHRRVEIDRRRAALRRDVPAPCGVREVGTAELRRLAPPIHHRWAARTPGALSRTDAWWDALLADREHQRQGATALFHLVHADGYVSYRREHATRTCRIVDMATATDEAYVALWGTLLALDLVDTIVHRSMAAAEPLQFLLADPRQLRTVDQRDGMWARVLDVPAALSARHYAVETDVVLDVRDPFLDRGGRFRLRGGPDGAECVPADGGVPVVGIEMAALGTLLFGGGHAGALARAGLLAADDPAVLQRLDVAFRGERTPQHGTEF
ncbi:MAG TPA: GNAT family N-acetyltransferase [Pseudonocardia sp.]|nr:GNAT family N-acetyltransferase [Pseudonocardia sp.]